MAIRLSQEIKQTQNLLMTPQLQQAIKLLTLPHYEMTNVIYQELAENPILEEAYTYPNEKKNETDYQLENIEQQNKEPTPQETLNIKDENHFSEWESYLSENDNTSSTPNTVEKGDNNFNFENITSKGETLEEHLMWQLRMEDLTDKEWEVAEYIIHNLDPSGRLLIHPNEIFEVTHHDQEDTLEILKMIQNLDPVGCATSSLQECLMVQAQNLSPQMELVEKIITQYFSHLETKDYHYIAKNEKCTLDEVKHAKFIIKKLNPRPGKLVSSERTEFIVPDIYVHSVGDQLVVALNEEGVPSLKISNYYKSLVKKTKNNFNTETKDYIQEKFRSALWLIKSIQNRQKTILKVTESIVRLQPDFFKKGPHFLKPMILKDVAQEIGVHESTVSRVTVNKYVHTPLGIYELKYFFNTGLGGKQGGTHIAVGPLKLKIKKLISMESPERPLSDQKIVEILGKEDIKIARRTVAKYREVMGILPSSKRRQRKC